MLGCSGLGSAATAMGMFGGFGYVRELVDFFSLLYPRVGEVRGGTVGDGGIY